MSAGKGDRPRPVDYKKYCANYDDIFRKPKPKEEDARLETNNDGHGVHGGCVSAAALHRPELG
jgi:hypothetical protein